MPTEQNKADKLREAIERLTSKLSDGSITNRVSAVGQSTPALHPFQGTSIPGQAIGEMKVRPAPPPLPPAQLYNPIVGDRGTIRPAPSAETLLPQTRASLMGVAFARLHAALSRQPEQVAPSDPGFNFAAEQSRQRAYMSVKIPPGGPPQPPGTQLLGSPSAPQPQRQDQRLDSETKKAAAGFGLLNTKLLAFAGVVAAATRGLDGTKEGYLLGYSIQHVFFEIADMLRTPIRIITNEIEGFARVLRAINQSSGGVGGVYQGVKRSVNAGTDNFNLAEDQQNKNLGFLAREADVGSHNHDEKLYQLGLSSMQKKSDELGKSIAEDNAKKGPWAVDIGFGGIGWHKNPDEDLKKRYDSEIATAKQQHEKFAALPAQKEKVGPHGVASLQPDKKTDPHLQPQLTASFGDISGLQAQMQKLATENPAQEKGLSMIEQIYNVLVSINNGMPGANHINTIPQQGLAHG